MNQSIVRKGPRFKFVAATVAAVAALWLGGAAQAEAQTRPDLRIESVKRRCYQVGPSEFEVKIFNRGTAPFSGPVDVDVFVGRTTPPEEGMSSQTFASPTLSLAPGASTTVKVRANATVNDGLNISAFIDTFNLVPELKEGNNSFFRCATDYCLF